MGRILERQKMRDVVAVVAVVPAEAVASAGVCFSMEGVDQHMVGN